MVEPLNPLAARAASSSKCAAVQLAALPPATRLNLRGNASELVSLGMTLPDTCCATIDGERALLWLGPDEFLLLLPPGDAPVMDVAAATVDVSHRDIGLSVSGPCAVWAINAFCALDLHPSAFLVGRCTRTLFGKAEILLWRMGDEMFRIDVPRSFAPYVWDCLEEARREFLAC